MSRKSRPAWRNVSRVWSRPRRWSIVACRSWTWTLFSTDDYGYYAVADKVHVHDLHATVLHQLGLDHTRLTYRHAGRDFRLTDVHGHVVHELIS